MTMQRDSLPSWATMVADAKLNWYRCFSIPLVAAFVGYAPKLLAL